MSAATTISATTSPQYQAERRTPPFGGVDGGGVAADTLFYRVMETAPMGLLVSAALGLAIVGVFQFLFYFGVLPAGWPWLLTASISAALAFFFEGLGFYFLVATVRDFSAGHRREGYIGLSATFLLWAYALWESHHISVAFDAGGHYWAIMGIIGTIVCVVRVVELRITLTVTSAYQTANEVQDLRSALEVERRKYADAAEKVSAFENENRRIQDEKESAERAAELAEKQRIEEESKRRFFELQAEKDAAESALAELQKKVARSEKRIATKGTGRPLSSSRAEIERRIKEFYQRSKVLPTQKQAAEFSGVNDPRTIRALFPNGAWDAFLETLQKESTAA